MFDQTRTSFTFLFIVALCAGCQQATPDDDEDVDEVSQADTLSNNWKLNGIELNGLQFNGLQFNGLQFNGLQLNNININDVQLQGTSLMGIRSDNGQTVQGLNFVGANLYGILSNSTSLNVRIDAATFNQSFGMYFYTVSYQRSDQSWSSLCGYDGSSNPIQATTVPGRWDETTGSYIPDSSLFTFACQGGALAKCVEWGYKWWSASPRECLNGDCHDIPLQNIHQACTRLVRADYCGDGVPHTMNGTTIDIWDNVGVQLHDPQSTMPLEAEWTANGASCILHTRWAHSESDNPDKDYVMAHCPGRWAEPNGNCGNDSTSTFVTANGYQTSLSTRVLLRNESNNNISP